MLATLRTTDRLRPDPRRCGLLLALLLLLTASGARAQQIVGTVIDRATQLPVADASVLVLNPDSSLRHSLITDEQGRFATPSTAGAFLVRVAGLGYGVVWSQPLELRRQDTADFVIQLPPRPIELTGIESVAEDAWFRALNRRLDPNGFYDRMQARLGRYLTPEQIDRRKPNQVADLLVAMPGVMVQTASSGTTLEGRGGCTPTVFINNVRIPRDAVQGIDGFYIEQFVHPSRIRGVEVYHDANFAPAPFLPHGGRGSCAVVVIWTYVGVEVAVPDAEDG